MIHVVFMKDIFRTKVSFNCFFLTCLGRHKLIYIMYIFIFYRKQSLCSPRITKHRCTLDETRNIIWQTKTDQQQGCKQQQYPGKQIYL